MKKVALLGVGMVSDTYAEVLNKLQSRVQLAGVLGSKPESGKNFLVKHTDKFTNNVSIYENIEQIIQEKTVDFAIIATSPNNHLESFRKLAEAGIPILIEKPVGRSLSEIREIEKVKKSTNIKCGVVLQHRVRASVTALRERINHEEFGFLNLIEIYVPWWRDQTYYQEKDRGTYKRDGGGVLISQAIHTLDIACSFAGTVESVISQFSTMNFHQMEAEDTVTAGIKFTSGTIGNLFVSTACYPGRTEEIIFHFDSASVRLQSNLLEINYRDGKKENVGSSVNTGAGANPMDFTSDWHHEVVSVFIDYLDDKSEPIANLTTAIKMHELITALTISAREDRRVLISEVGENHD